MDKPAKKRERRDSPQWRDSLFELEVHIFPSRPVSNDLRGLRVRHRYRRNVGFWNLKNTNYTQLLYSGDLVSKHQKSRNI